MLDLLGINFRNCGTLIDPGHRGATAGDVVYVSNMPFEQSPSAAISRRAAAGVLVAILLT